MTETIDPNLYRSPLLRFECSKCMAQVGEECVTASGKITYDCHGARYAAEARYYGEIS